MVLDRPNPNGMYVDGPILDMKYESGVGRLPIPIVHGLTMGEIATMANGEGWLKGGKKVPLTVIKCKGYTHQSRYVLPIAPSPTPSIFIRRCAISKPPRSASGAARRSHSRFTGIPT